MSVAPSSFILVVDDDKDIRESLCDLLSEEGYQVECVENGQLALDRLRSGARPCLILLDLMMPVMDGATFRAHQLADPELVEIPVVVITAAGKRAGGAVSSGVVLQKPLALEQVVQIVGEHCRG